jgi:hypothetical protein
MSLTPARSSWAALTAVIATGTSLMLWLRFCAVTTTVSMPLSALALASGLAPLSPLWARAGFQIAARLIERTVSEPMPTGCVVRAYVVSCCAGPVGRLVV